MNVKEIFKSDEFKSFCKQLIISFLALLTSSVQARFLQQK